MRLTHFLTQLSECWVASARSCWDQVGCVRSRVRTSVRSARYWASASIAPPPFSLGVSSETVDSIPIEEVYDVRKQRGDDDRKPYTRCRWLCGRRPRRPLPRPRSRTPRVGLPAARDRGDGPTRAPTS